MKKRVLLWLLIVSLLVPSFVNADVLNSLQENDIQSIETPTLEKFVKQANKEYDDNDEVEIIVTLDHRKFENLGKEVPANLLYDDYYLNQQVEFGNNVLDASFSLLERNGIHVDPIVTYNTLFVGFATRTDYATAKKIANSDFVEMVEMTVEREKPTLNHQEMVGGGFRSASFYKPLSEMIDPINSRDLVGSEEVYKNNKGEGMVISIIDSGYDLQHDSYYLTDIGKSNAKLSESTVRGIIDSGSVSRGKYVSDKVPFVYNYASKNTYMKEAKFASHGQHVAGIAAGNKVEYMSGNKKGHFIGIAPEAQLVLMRVFSDDSPTTSSMLYTKALEDALHLKVDSVNMSLGSPAGDHRNTEETTVNAINRLSEAGCVVAIAAGNDTAFGHKANRRPSVDNPDYGILASPALIDRSLAVASLQNDTVTLKYVDVLDNNQVLRSYALDWQETPKAYDYRKKYEIVDIGLGKEEDVKNVDLTGKYALIERGEITFPVKIKNAMSKNAEGVIVYNSVQGGESFFNMAGIDELEIPVASMKRSGGLFIKENTDKQIKFSKQEGTFDSDTKGQLSSFSSFGLTADGTFKPEITAPGGNIYSLANNNSFTNQSGTSMASPQVAGGIALVKNRVNKDFSYLNDAERWQMVKNLLMSTAKVHYNKTTGAASSPRNQGAGVMNLSGALSSNIVLRSGEAGETKIIHKAATSQQEITFSVLNYSDKAESFKYKAVVVRDEIENGQFTLRPEAIKTIEGKTIQVSPRNGNQPGEQEVSMIIDTTDVQDELKRLMPNGYFIDGFVILSNDTMELSIPFVTFVGGKTGLDELSYVEDSIYNLTKEGKRPFYFKPNVADYTQNHDSTHLFTKVGKNQILGSTDKFTMLNPTFTEKYAVSPNNDGIADDLGLRFVMLRNGNVGFDVYKVENGEKVVDSKVTLGEGDYQKNFGKAQGDNSHRLPNIWPTVDTVIEEGDHVMVIRNWGPRDKSQAAKDVEIPFTVDITRPIIKDIAFDDASRKLNFTAEDAVSGIRRVEVSYIKDKKKVVVPLEDGYTIPAEVDLKDVQILVVDYGYNALRAAASTLLSSNSYGTVKPDLQWEAEKDPNIILEYDIYPVKDDQKAPQPIKENLLPYGKYVLVVKNLSPKYVLKDGMEYPFEITPQNKDILLPIPIRLIPSHTVSIMVSRGMEHINRIVAQSRTNGREIVLFDRVQNPNKLVISEILPYDEYEITFDKSIQESKIKIYQSRASDKIGFEERILLGIFENSFTIVVDKNSRLTSRGILNYQVEILSEEQGSIDVVQTGEDLDVEYHVIESDGEEVLISPMSLLGKNPKGAIFDIDKDYAVMPVNLPEGYYSVPARNYVSLRTGQPQATAEFEIKKSEGFGSVTVTSNAKDIPNFEPKFVAYDIDTYYGLRKNVKTDDLSNLPHGNWVIVPEVTEEFAHIASEPDFIEVAINEKNEKVTIDFKFEEVDTSAEGIITSTIRESKEKEYELEYIDIKTGSKTEAEPREIGYVAPLNFGAYKVNIKNLEDDHMIAYPEFFTMHYDPGTAIYQYINIIVVPKTFYDETNPDKSELYTIWAQHEQIIGSSDYIHASVDKREAYDEALKAARKSFDNLAANQEEVDEAIRNLKEAAQALEAQDVNVGPPSNNENSGGGSSNSSVRPDPVSAPSKETKPTQEVIEETKPSLSEPQQPKVVATLKINSKEHKMLENGALVSRTSEVSPMLHQGRTMLPARMIAELLGIEVSYDENTRTARFVFMQEEKQSKKENVVELTLGQKTMKVNGKEQPLTADILNVNGRVLLPMTDVQKALKELGLSVDVKWNHETKEISILK